MLIVQENIKPVTMLWVCITREVQDSHNVRRQRRDNTQLDKRMPSRPRKRSFETSSHEKLRAYSSQFRLENRDGSEERIE